MRNIQYERDDFVTRRQLADTGIASYDKLAADAVKGVGIPYSKFGSKVLYKWGDVLDFLEANRVSPKSAA